MDLGGNSVQKYENMNYAIIEGFDQIDASEKGTFHVTVWRTGDAADTVLGVKLVDYPTGDGLVVILSMSSRLMCRRFQLASG